MVLEDLYIFLPVHILYYIIILVMFFSRRLSGVCTCSSTSVALFVIVVYVLINYSNKNNCNFLENPIKKVANLEFREGCKHNR